jgi:hypothetical protein
MTGREKSRKTTRKKGRKMNRKRRNKRRLHKGATKKTKSRGYKKRINVEGILYVLSS